MRAIPPRAHRAITHEPDRAFRGILILSPPRAFLMADAVLAGPPGAEVADLVTGFVAAQSAQVGRTQRLRHRIAPLLG